MLDILRDSRVTRLTQSEVLFGLTNHKHCSVCTKIAQFFSCFQASFFECQVAQTKASHVMPLIQRKQVSFM